MQKKITNYLLHYNLKPPMKFWWLLLLLVLVFIPHLYLSYHVYCSTTMPDLILRITGSRFLSLGKNPYFSLWQPGNPIELFNPNLSLHSPANGVTSTPFALLLQKSFAALPYCTITKCWWIFQEACLFISFLLCWQLPSKKLQQLLVIIITTIFFMFSYNWWLNIYNGQMYVLYLLAFSLTSFAIIKKHNYVLHACIYPFIVLIRPFFVLVLVPLAQFKKRWFSITFFAGCMAMVCVCLTTNTQQWQQYFAAMKVYAGEAVNSKDWHVERTNEYYFHQKIVPEACTNNNGKVNIPYSGGCLYSVQHYLAKMGLKIDNSLVFSCALLLLVGLLYAIFIQQKISTNKAKRIAFSVLLYFLAELFTPASRNPYGMIQWMPVVTIILMSEYYKLSALVIIGLMLNHNLLPLKYTKELGELFLLLALVLFVFSNSFTRNKEISNNATSMI